MTDFDLSSIPDLVNDVLFAGASETAAQLILSVVLIFTCLLPMIATKQKPEIMLAMVALVVFVETAIGWLSETAAIVIVLIVAAMMAKTLGRWVGG
jgi:hypothetical protein